MSQSGPLSPVAEHHAGSQPSDAGTEAAGSSQSPSNGGPPGGNGTHCGQQRLGSPDRPSAAEREETLRRSRGSPSVARRATVAWGASTVRGLSRQISIERLPEEGKRIDGLGSGGGGHSMRREPSMDQGPLNQILRTLLRPDDWSPPPNGRFPFGLNTIKWLCQEAQAVLAVEPTVVDLRAPVKVFGDIHGQFADLMRLFREYGVPMRESEMPRSPAPPSANMGGRARSPLGVPPLQQHNGAVGDLLYTDYLFLGDYVDRGSHSLEVMVLLLALKIRHPARIFLLRGNHELPEVNARDGFLLECCQRLESKEAGIEAWHCFNSLFDWLPLAATINGVILCLHGGVGATLNHLEDLRRLQRPLRMHADAPHAALMLDVLWSDPTEHDSIEGVHPNAERGDPVVRYGPDRVRSFLRMNGFKLIVRGHECVMDGFQRFAGGALITIFSATNYCGVCENAGALLIIGKGLECVPKLIYPCAELEDAWLRSEDMRPATPPRQMARAERGQGRGGDDIGEGGSWGKVGLPDLDLENKQAGGVQPRLMPRVLSGGNLGNKVNNPSPVAAGSGLLRSFNLPSASGRLGRDSSSSNELGGLNSPMLRAQAQGGGGVGSFGLMAPPPVRESSDELLCSEPVDDLGSDMPMPEQQQAENLLVLSGGDGGVGALLRRGSLESDGTQTQGDGTQDDSQDDPNDENRQPLPLARRFLGGHDDSPPRSRQRTTPPPVVGMPASFSVNGQPVSFFGSFAGGEGSDAGSLRSQPPSFPPSFRESLNLDETKSMRAPLPRRPSPEMPRAALPPRAPSPPLMTIAVAAAAAAAVFAVLPPGLVRTPSSDAREREERELRGGAGSPGLLADSPGARSTSPSPHLFRPKPVTPGQPKPVTPIPASVSAPAHPGAQAGPVGPSVAGLANLAAAGHPGASPVIPTRDDSGSGSELAVAAAAELNLDTCARMQRPSTPPRR
mmetsp:Transcript_11735/g.27424  ORF Transcript_11735/g.27424 Transcript_11735/m.27424 type:complete len:957 (+) Transcript_11735:73-2943(+)